MQNVLVLGATGGSGRAAVEALLAKGHTVSAFVRRRAAFTLESPRLRVIEGDATDPDSVAKAVRGHDAVVVALGIRESPLRVRLRGSAHTALDVRSAGTRNVVAAMQKEGVRRLVVQSSYGVGATRGRQSFSWKLIFALLLKPQIDDTEEQERVVRASGLDWVLAQPVGLTDEESDGAPFVSTDGEARTMSISRRSVARFLVDAIENPAFVGQSVALSAP